MEGENGLGMQPAPERDNTNKVFVGGLAPHTTAESLKEAFESNFGAVTNSHIMEFFDKMQNVKRSRGFGFVTFADSTAVDSACQTHLVEVDGKSCEIKRIDEQKSSAEGKAEVEARKIFCGGLADTVDSEKLKAFFQAMDPNIIDAKVMTDNMSGRSRCFGYVTFSAKEFVDRAVANREANYVDNKWVDVKPSTDGGFGKKGKGKKGGKQGPGGGFMKGKGVWDQQGYGQPAYGGAAQMMPAGYADPYGYGAGAQMVVMPQYAYPGYATADPAALAAAQQYAASPAYAQYAAAAVPAAAYGQQLQPALAADPYGGKGGVVAYRPAPY